MAQTLDLSLVTLLTTAAALSGSDLDGVLRDLDVSIGAATHNRPFQDLALGPMLDVLNELERRATRLPFPFAFARVFNFDGQPEIPAFLASAGSMRETTRLLDWLPRLVHPAIRVERAEADGRATLTLRVDDPGGRHADAPVLVEMMAAVVVQVCRLLDAAADDALLGVHFGHAARTARATYEGFYRCALSFEAPATRLVFDSRNQDSRLPGSLPVAHARAEETIRQRLQATPPPPPGPAPGPTARRVEDLLRQHPGLLGQTIKAVARRLHVHPRTLQRRLRTENQTYNDLLARVRHRLACEWLRAPRPGIDAIAEKLGFAERRSFSQAFRQWQGQTPSAFRRRPVP